MPDTIDAIITEHLATKWRGTSNAQAMRLLAEGSPADATRLILASLGRITESTTFLDFAISFIPADDFPRVVDAALARLRDQRDDEHAASVIAYASLQSPHSLHRHLDELFDVAPNRSSYYGPFPWRESGMLAFDRLRAVVADRTRDAETRSFAWAALLETRTPQALELALASYDGGHPHFYPDLESNLRFVGYARRGGDGSLARITPQRVMHLRFPDESLTRPKLAPPNPTHPTWRLVDEPVVTAAARFGGESPDTCNCCGGALNHLITLDPVPGDLGVTSVPRIGLVTCLSCLGWEVHPATFYEHDARTGVARDITETERRNPEFVNGPFLETTVAIVDSPRRWRWQDWGLANGRENLHRIGGQPCWIQQADVPACPRCRETMSFLMQLDSDLPTTTHEEFDWGSDGIAYGFWCDACRVSAWLWQCT